MLSTWAQHVECRPIATLDDLPIAPLADLVCVCVWVWGTRLPTAHCPLLARPGCAWLEPAKVGWPNWKSSPAKHPNQISLLGSAGSHISLFLHSRSTFNWVKRWHSGSYMASGFDPGLLLVLALTLARYLSLSLYSLYLIHFGAVFSTGPLGDKRSGSCPRDFRAASAAGRPGACCESSRTDGHAAGRQPAVAKTTRGAIPLQCRCQHLASLRQCSC